MPNVAPTLYIYTVNATDSIRTAMLQIENNTAGFAVVLGSQVKKVTGVVTDGDIRRALLDGERLDAPVQDIVGSNPVVISARDGIDKVASLFKDIRINFIPVVDANYNLLNIITKRHFHNYLLHAGNFSPLVNFFEYSPDSEDQHINPRPWGFYKTIFLNADTRAKILCVYPEQQLSLQYHYKREEHWTVVCGTAEITLGSTVRVAHPGDYTFVPKECRHRLRNPDKENILMVNEVQLGQAFDEDDIVRIHDDYGRSAE